MLKWLKFTFGSFFSNSISKEGATRSFWNVIFALFLSFIIMLSFLSGGYNFSIATHYSTASEFKELLYETFANEVVDDRIELTISKDEVRQETIATATSAKDGKPIIINTFENDADSQYKVNDYNLIIDTRNSETTFFTFSMNYFLISDKTSLITADQYRALEDKSEYTGSLEIHNELVNVKSFKLDVNGNGLLDESDPIYTPVEEAAFLDTFISTLNEENVLIGEYDAIKKLDKESDEYANKLYNLFIRCYYSIEKTPTNILYYQNKYAELKDGVYVHSKFLLLTDIWSIVSFKNDKNIPLTFDGYYTELQEGSFYSIQTVNNIDSIKGNIDDFIIKVFSSVSSIRTLIVGMNVFSFMPYIILSIIVFGLLVYCICKLRKRAYGEKYIEACKIVSSYVIVSSSFAGILGLISFFLVDSTSAYGIGCWGLLSIIGFRTLALVISEEIAYKKNPLRDNVVKVSSPKFNSSNDSVDLTENINLSNVDSGTKIIKNDLDEDEEEKMELM